MAVIQGGASGALQGVGEEAASASHMTIKPVPVGANGAYSIAVATGAIGAGASANSEIVQFRWTDASKLCVVHSIVLTGMRATTAFAAGAIDLEARVARGWSADGSGGGTATLTGENNALRTSFATAVVGAVRTATTAALTAGTKTLDANPLGQILTHSSAGWQSATPIIGQIFLPKNELFKPDVAANETPLILAQNEGFVVRATVPATGVWNLGVQISWSEVTTY